MIIKLNSGLQKRAVGVCGNDGNTLRGLILRQAQDDGAFNWEISGHAKNQLSP
jgi:hypothetical protein